MFKFEIDEKVVDEATGFAGIVTGRTEYKNTAPRRRYGVTAPEKINITPTTIWFNEDRLTIVDAEKLIKAGEETVRLLMKRIDHLEEAELRIYSEANQLRVRVDQILAAQSAQVVAKQELYRRVDSLGPGDYVLCNETKTIRGGE